MINTDNYIRWERVDSVSQTATGILAELHREQLKIDVVRADVLRIKISRGGVFDESPTFAVCVDPLASPVDFRVEQDPERVQLITAACTASLWLDPFRIDVHRSDGSPVIETAQDADGRLLGVRDTQRLLHGPTPLPPGGRDLRVGREVWRTQPQGPRLHHVEPRRTEPRRDVGVHRRQGCR